MHDKAVKAPSVTYRKTFLNQPIIFIHTLGPRQGSNFMDIRFHNPHSQIHHQGLSCSPCAQPLKQAQDYQRYTLKDNLS